MPSLKEIQRRLKRATKPKLQKEVVRLVLTDLEIRKLKKEEFKRGEAPDGSVIGTYRSKNYELFKSQLNPLAGGAVDLILTGKFTNQLYVRSLGNGRFTFESQDDKAPMLFEKYGQDLKGFNEETWERLQAEKYAPKLIRHIKQITNL